MSPPSSPTAPFLLGAAIGSALGYALAVAAAPHGGLARVLHRKLAELTGAAPAGAPPPQTASSKTVDAAPVPRPPSAHPPKMVICVRRDLDMGRGKTAAQAAHAAVALFKKAKRAKDPLLRAWEVDGGSAKVVLRVDGAADLDAVEAAAAKAGLPCAAVVDAGRTQVAPGSRTCVAVLGPAASVDAVTGGLKLL